MVGNDYDYNVWSADDGEINLTAYVPDTDYKHFFSRTFELNTEPEMVEYLIEHPEPKRVIKEGLTDYDDWVSFQFLTRDNTKLNLIEWLGNLAPTEIKGE
jgi:hypothetical protein